ncbi:MAG: hypothetical protein BMS9Abin36_2015 [Gammaproteobacteria bacterium]|nr:MAG: hypothetical protein BMS9Abin36_2015 [Gammaproteobacteria bacterium]
MSKPKNGPAISNFLPDRLIKTIRQKAGTDALLGSCWQREVSAPLNEHTRPIRFEQGVLVVETESSAWASRLRFEIPSWVAHLQRFPEFEGLHEIKVKVIPKNSPIKPSTSSAIRETRISDSSASLIRKVAAGMEDDELRRALERLGDKK